jgi:hypothetical protein
MVFEMIENLFCRIYLDIVFPFLTIRHFPAKSKNMVLISREDRSQVYNYLLKEGVIVVKKDARLVSHQELRGIPNIRVMMILKSLKSNSLVEETFSW